MKLLFAASEAAPLIQSGGLGDVMRALPESMTAYKNVAAAVFLPYYEALKRNSHLRVHKIAEFYVPLSQRFCYVGLYKAVGRRKKLSYYFIDHEGYFFRPSLYGYYDDGERFAYFSKAILESLQYLHWYPDVIHCNDWQSALIPLFLDAHYRQIPEYSNIRTVYTIHNGEYQGKADYDFIREIVGVNGIYAKRLLQGHGCNVTKGAILSADWITTVSPSYAEELKSDTGGYGLQKLLRKKNTKFCGILNGIQTELFDPSHDPWLATAYDADHIEGKYENKRVLRQMLCLDQREDCPLIGVVSRFVFPKGMDLIRKTLDKMVDSGWQIVLLGQGEEEYEKFFRECAWHHPGMISANIFFSTELAHRIYAASDLFLMPSYREPCGLAQMIAMRYGAIPVVHATGGLKDTVRPIHAATGEGQGFTFSKCSPEDLLATLNQAVEYWRDEERRRMLMHRLMNTDFGWGESAERYKTIYFALTQRENRENIRP